MTTFEEQRIEAIARAICILAGKIPDDYSFHHDQIAWKVYISNALECIKVDPATVELERMREEVKALREAIQTPGADELTIRNCRIVQNEGNREV